MDLNALKQYMDFFKQNRLGGTDYSAHNGFNPTPFDPNTAALSWAERMMGNGGNGGTSDRMPDYFGGQSNQTGYSPSQYVQPQQFGGQRPAAQNTQQPLTGQVNNYLAQLMGRR